MTPAKDSKPSGAMEQQSPNKAQKRKTDSPSRHEECPAMVIIKKRKHSAGPPDLQTTGSVAGNTRKRPATAVAVCESCPSVVKRRKIPSPPQHEELTAVTEKCMHSNDRAAGDTSVTTSSCNKKRSASESSPRSAKRRKIPSQSPNEQTAAVIKKRENTTQEAAGENSVTVSNYNKKRSASESSPRFEKRRKIHHTPSTSKASDPFRVDQNTKTKETKGRREKPTKLSEKREIARLLHKQGVRLFKKSEVRDITSLGTKLLGSGSYGSCHLAVDPNTRQPLVIKKFPRDGLDDLATEATNLHALRLPGVQRLVGVCVSKRQMITGFAGTTLSKYFLTRPSFADAISVFLQISRTLQQMLDKGFSHNDIKGDNICVQVDSNAPKATIIDLGLARRVGTTEIYEYTSDTESYPWLAPELLLHTHPCGEASDVYSVAQLLEEELLSGNTRVQRHHMAALTRWILRAQKLNPRKRPRLAALIDLLQQLHQEATRDTKE
ncbi:uncharacterized protein LOC135102549 [Scylla paramamosain]|uniref:uncharacterized protein LOC135102549 n=1 Tax=Scylla paramamosain TaxID=85552 RepID=UPI003082D72D